MFIRSAGGLDRSFEGLTLETKKQRSNWKCTQCVKFEETLSLWGEADEEEEEQEEEEDDEGRLRLALPAPKVCVLCPAKHRMAGPSLWVRSGTGNGLNSPSKAQDRRERWAHASCATWLSRSRIVQGTFIFVYVQ